MDGWRRAGTAMQVDGALQLRLRVAACAWALSRGDGRVGGGRRVGRLDRRAEDFVSMAVIAAERRNTSLFPTN